MKKIMPTPKLLPIRVNLVVESKPGMKMENVHVKPYDNARDLLKIIEEQQSVVRGDPVVKWNEHNIKILLTGPLYNAA